MRFQTRFAFDLGPAQVREKAECAIEVERSHAGPIEVTLYESGLRGGEIVRARYAQISSEFYRKFLRGIPAQRIKWSYRRTLESELEGSRFEIPLIWENGGLYRAPLKS